MRHLISLMMWLLMGCRLDPARIASHDLFADDGARMGSEGPARFAVVGNTRGWIPGMDRGRSRHPAVTPSIIEDIRSAVVSGGPTFAVMLGDAVRWSDGQEWRAFDQRFVSLLAGSTASEGTRIQTVMVAGDRERVRDPRYVGLGAALPETGAEIGHNRIATWSAFDVTTGGATWRFLLLDSGKADLGSRWKEQLLWIRRALQGEFDGLLVFFHDPLLDLSGVTPAMNNDGAPEELLEIIDGQIGLMKLRAVFAAGGHTTQVFLPDGPMGTLFVNAGGGGAPADDLSRWGPGEAAGRAQDVHLEPKFDLTLMAQVDAGVRAETVAERVVDRAKARGSYDGFTGLYEAAPFPTYGWWMVTLDGPVVTLLFRMWRPDGSLFDAYRISLSREAGWRAGISAN